MTPERTKELLPIMTAFAEGKKIRLKRKNDPSDPWVICTNPTWADNFDYEIAPEPKEFWVVRDESGKDRYRSAFDTPREANHYAKAWNEGFKGRNYIVHHVKTV